MRYAEEYAVPVDGEIGVSLPLRNAFKDLMFLRWGWIRFDLFWGEELNLKVLVKVHRNDNTCERFMVDTDPCETKWNRHQRNTREFCIHPFPQKQGRVTAVTFAFILHHRGVSIPSQHEYLFMEGYRFDENKPQYRRITTEMIRANTYRTYEMEAGLLQRDVDWYNQHYDSLLLIPKFTKGQPGHPYHPKRYIHDQMDNIIRNHRERPDGTAAIKVCVPCLDDTDFVNHLIYASDVGIKIQCIVDWTKMVLTNSDNYVRLKRSNVELLGVFCSPKHPLIEVAPEMHAKFIIFGEMDCILGSFNITFDRWGANWESGMTFHSHGVCRLLNNVFQSIRGGVIQPYGIDPFSHFNLLYTFGRHGILNGQYYRPHHAIISEIHRARRSIKLCLFLMGEMEGEHQDSVVEALIRAKHRGVDVRIILNGHMAREGDPGRAYPMEAELRRPLLPAVRRLIQGGVPVVLAYGIHDRPVPYCPIHSKYCVIDDHIVLDGSFNWYNTSVFSHDLLAIAANPDTARPYLYEFDQILRNFRT